MGIIVHIADTAPSQMEDGATTVVKKKYACGLCKERGHNKTTCPMKQASVGLIEEIAM